MGEFPEREPAETVFAVAAVAADDPRIPRRTEDDFPQIVIKSRTALNAAATQRPEKEETIPV